MILLALDGLEPSALELVVEQQAAQLGKPFAPLASLLQRQRLVGGGGGQGGAGR